MFHLKYFFLRFKCSAVLAPCYSHMPWVKKRHFKVIFKFNTRPGTGFLSHSSARCLLRWFRNTVVRQVGNVCVPVLRKSLNLPWHYFIQGLQLTNYVLSAFYNRFFWSGCCSEYGPRPFFACVAWQSQRANYNSTRYRITNVGNNWLYTLSKAHNDWQTTYKLYERGTIKKM